MKNNIKYLFSTALLSCFLSTPVLAANQDWYIGASGDLTWLNHSSTGGGGNIDLGYRFWPSDFGGFRAEAEVGYHGVPNDKGYTGNTHYFDYMANILYDFNGFQSFSSQSLKVIPYVGVGIGDATVKYGQRHGIRSGFNNTFADFSSHDNAFAYQGMVGLTFVAAAMPNTDWTVGYKYLGTDKENGNRLNANNINLGVRFHF